VTKKVDKREQKRPGRLVHVMTQEELLEDMRLHTLENTKTKELALAFLQRAGIVDETGQLAKPYRS
jgi:hypothetical protein